MSFCSSLPNFIQNRTRKMTSIFTMADLRHLEFYGSNNEFFENPYRTCYRSSIDIILLSFWENRVFMYAFLATDRQTDKQTNWQTDGQPNVLSRKLRYRERRLNKKSTARGTTCGRSSDRRTFPVLCSTCSWLVTTYVGKPSTVSQPTRPTQPFTLSK